ncbi:hypothetical protein L1279_002374 [Planomicrobium sp. HSC-17F08]|nr:hypothetical protein [Planomicrobium sp. HSC-17F08]
MGAQVFPGRFTADTEEDFVVFIIGMRINKYRAVRKWFPVLMAMPPMIRELSMNKELGCLSVENFIGLRTTIMVQYWRSEKELLAYAKGTKHLPAWRNFNNKVGNNDAVGIYHETYLIQADGFETIYGNMPKFGLARAIGSNEITAASNSAHKRIKKNHVLQK